MRRREWIAAGLALVSGLGIGYGAGVVRSRPPRLRTGFAVSQWQQSIDWVEVAQTRPAFVYIKATEGVDHLDRRFHDNLAAATAQGLHTGAYHYYRADRDPLAQARWFSDTLLAAGSCTALPPVLDLEHSQGAQSDAELSAGVVHFLDALGERFGPSMIYTTERFATAHTLAAALARYPLWLGDYERALAPQVPAPWTDWALWQFTEAAQVAGVPVACTQSLVSETRLATLLRDCV